MNFAPAANARAYPESPWSDDRLIRMTALWAEGLSAAETARKLNEEFGTTFTRSSVIGKVHRQKLAKREVENRGRWVRENTIHQRLAAADIVDALIPIEQRKTLFNLGRRDCRFPIGDPCSRDFFFCGGESLETAPYCAGHAKRAYGYVSEKAKF